MEETLDIQQQVPQQEDPPRKKLWGLMRKKELYTKSYEDFESQFSTPEKIDKLHKFLLDKEIYTKTTQDFKTQFFSDKQEPAPSKKKVGTVTFGETYSSPELDSETPSTGKIPEVIDFGDGDIVADNPILLSKKYDELKGQKKTIPQVGGGSSFSMGTGSVEVPDENAVKLSGKIKDYLVESGINPDQLNTEMKGVSDEDLNVYGEELLADRKQNPQLYQRKLGRLKWERGLNEELLKSVESGRLNNDDYNNISASIKSSLENSSVGDYKQQRENVNSVANAIKQFGGENKDQLLKEYATEVSKVYGNSYNFGFGKTKEETPEGKYLTTPEAQLGYDYIKDLSPEKAEQYKRLFVDVKSLNDKPEEQKGYNHLMQTLEETGIGLMENSVNEELNNLKTIAEKTGGLTPEQIDKATKLEEKLSELNQKKTELDSKYPDRINDKVDDAIQEILGQNLSWGSYAAGSAGKAFKNTAQGVWEAVSKPFMSDESNRLRELYIMGQSLDENQIYRKTDANKALVTDTLVIKPELQLQIDAIKNDKTLSREQKELKLYPLLKNNSDKFGRVPIQGGKFNVNPSSILYGVTDLGTTLLPFIALETATGGIGGAGAAAKFLRTFTAAAATSFHDEYANAILEGKSESDAYKEAMGLTAINSFAMAGAGTPEAVRSMAGLKTSAGQIISRMSDAEIKKVLERGTKSKALNALKDRISATPEMIKKGAESGAKFEVAMNAAQEAKKQLYNTEIDREEQFKHNLLNIANFSLLGGVLGHVGYKSPSNLQKSGLVEFGKNPDGFLASIEQMKKEGSLSQADFDQRKGLIEKSAEAYKALPQLNDKGKPLSATEQGEILYNTVIKNEGKKAASTLPPQQAEKAEMRSMVADYANGIILENPTDKQLESRKNTLEKQIEGKDENGKPLLPEKELLKAKAQLEAVNNAIEHKQSFDQSVKLEKRDFRKPQGNPEEISQPIELSIEPTVKEKAPTVSDVSGGEGFNVGKIEQPSVIENSIAADAWLKGNLVNETGQKRIDRLNELEEVVNKSRASESDKKLSIDAINRERENLTQPTNEAKANEVQQSTEVKEPTITEANKVGEEAEETQKTEAGEPPIVPPGTPVVESEGAFVEPPEISFRKDSFVRARSKVGIDEFVDEGKTTHIAESTKAQRTVEKWKEDGSYAENIADIQDRASRGEISNQEKFIFAKHLADLDATVNAIKDVNSKEYDIALGEYNKALNAADAARSAAGRQLGMIPKNRGTAQTLADVMSDMMNDNKADVLTTEQKKTAEKRYEKVKEALDKEAALRIEAEAKAEELRAENALLKKQVEGKGKPKEGKVYKDGKRDFDAETKNYKDELKKLAEEYKAAGQKLGISSDGGGESFVISAKMAKVVMKIVGVKVEQMGVKLKEVTEATLKEVKDIFDGITEKDIREIIAGKYNEKKATKNDLLSQMHDLKQEQKLLFELEALENGETPKTEKALKAKNQRLKEIRDKIDALKKQNGIGKYSDESKVAAAEKAAQKNIEELEDKIANNDLEFDKIEKPTSPQLEAYREKQKALRKELEEKRKEAKVGKYSDESKVAAAEKAAQKNIEELEDKIANNDLEFDKIEKPTSPQLDAYREKQKALRKELEQKRKEAKVGKYSDESKFISAAKSRIEANRKKQQEISDKIKNKDFSEEPESKSILDNTELQKKNKKLYEEYLKSVIDKEKALFQYEQERIDDKIRNYNLAEKVGHWAELAFHTSKGSVAIFDQSGLLVQLIQTTLSHPWESAKNIVPALRDLITPKQFDANMAKLKQSKYWDLFQKMNLPLYDTHSHDINFRNDLLGGDKNLMNKDIVINGKKMSIGKAFERSTATLFNNIRVKLATEQIEKLHREGKTWENSPEEFKQAARVIAEFTGHGKVHKAFSNENWNILIWSSKMLASTFNVLGLGDIARPVSTAKAIGKGLEGTKVGNLLGIKNVSIDPKKSKGFYSSLTPQQRVFAAKEMSRFISAGATLLAAAYLKGQFFDDEDEKTTVDVNPLSTDFGTIKTGDKTINVYGRFSSAVGAIAQIMMGVRYLGGREDVLGDKYGDKSRADIAFGKFGRGKMTPAVGLGYDYMFNDKKNYFTKEKITGMGALKQAISPLAFQDIAKDIKREDPALSIALWTLFKVYGGNVRDRRDFIEQDLKVPEWKFLNDKGLKLTKKSKESLKPIDADGKPIEVTEDKYKDFLKKREEYVRQDIQKLMNGEAKIFTKESGWIELPKEILKDITYEQMESWMMSKTNAANDKATKDVFPNAVEPPEDKEGKVYTQ